MSLHIARVYYTHDRPHRWSLTISTWSLRHLIFKFIFGYGEYPDTRTVVYGWELGIYPPQAISQESRQLRGLRFRWGVKNAD